MLLPYFFFFSFSGSLMTRRYVGFHLPPTRHQNLLFGTHVSPNRLKPIHNPPQICKPQTTCRAHTNGYLIEKDLWPRDNPWYLDIYIVKPIQNVEPIHKWVPDMQHLTVRESETLNVNWWVLYFVFLVSVRESLSLHSTVVVVVAAAAAATAVRLRGRPELLCG
jgi:hypothetical protein